MRARFIIFGMLVVAATPSVAQQSQKTSVTDEQRKSTSDEKAAEIRALIEKARSGSRALIDRTKTYGPVGRTRFALAADRYQEKFAACERTPYVSWQAFRLRRMTLGPTAGSTASRAFSGCAESHGWGSRGAVGLIH